MRDNQPDLFYPNHPGSVPGDTSEDAADRIAGCVSRLRAKVLATFDGAERTCDEVEVLLEMRHQTCSARIRELVLMGRIEDTGRRRLTRSRRNARIYRKMDAS